MDISSDSTDSGNDFTADEVPIDPVFPLVSSPLTQSEQFGYDHDSAFYGSAPGTVSLSESLRGHVYENGRSYHSYQNGKYPLPNDQQEQQRLDLFHHVFTMWLRGEMFLAPIDNLRKVLDVGTGTGIWAMDVSEQYPNAEVIGNDLSPIQPSFVNPNLQFEIDDVELEWMHPPNTFDLIHIRCMSGHIEDWEFLLRQAYRCLKPGGYFEFQDFNNELSCVDEFPPDCAFKQWFDLVNEAAIVTRRPMMVAYRMKNLVEQSGFEEVVEYSQDWPYGPWHPDPQKREIGKWTTPAAIDSLHAFALGLLTRHLNWAPEAVDELCERASLELKQGLVRGSTESVIRFYSKLYIVYGRKPKISDGEEPLSDGNDDDDDDDGDDDDEDDDEDDDDKEDEEPQ